MPAYRHHVTMSPCHHVTMSPCRHTQSLGLECGTCTETHMSTPIQERNEPLTIETYMVMAYIVMAYMVMAYIVTVD